MDSILDVRSLRHQIYEFLRKEIQERRLVPGAFIKLNKMSKNLGVSKTPLRDAIIQLECEGFVSILPRRGVMLNRLTLQEIKHLLEILGALESATLRIVFDRITPNHIDEMERLNDEMRQCIRERSFDTFDPQYYTLNIDFHNVFIDLSINENMNQLITTMKQRLYDFPRLAYIKEWEWSNCDEHEQFIKHIRQGDRNRAANFWQEIHWGYEPQEKYIREFYAQGDRHIQKELEQLK